MRAKGKRLPAILTVLLLLAGIGGTLLVMRPQGDAQIEIVQDGTVLYRLDLSQEKNRAFSVEYAGRTNLIEIHDHQIRVAQAECPDQTCVHMNWLGSSGLPIVCLPNHLVIQFVQPPDGLDTVA